jgi:hypothetical protein
LTWLAIVLLLAAWSVQPTYSQDRLTIGREDFLKELVSYKSTPRTRLYDFSAKGSYRPNKVDMMRGLADTAKALGISLRGFLAIGPMGPDGTASPYYFYTFVDEKNTVRAVELTIVQNRITYKASRTMTTAKYHEFYNALIETGTVDRSTPASLIEKAHMENEGNYDVLLAQWSGGKSESYFGSILKPKAGAKANEFSKQVGELLRSMPKTYPLLETPPTQPPPRRNDKKP